MMINPRTGTQQVQPPATLKEVKKREEGEISGQIEVRHLVKKYSCNLEHPILRCVM